MLEELKTKGQYLLDLYNNKILLSKIKRTSEAAEATKVLSFLNEMRIYPSGITHKPALTCSDVEEDYQKVHFTGGHCKNIFLTDHNHFFLVVIDKTKKIDLSEFRIMYDTRKLHFASDEEVMQHLGVKPGALSILNFLNVTSHLVHLVIDKDILNYKSLAFHPNCNEVTLFIETSKITDIIREMSHKHQLNFIYYGISGRFHNVFVDVPEKEFSTNQKDKEKIITLGEK